MKIVFGMPDNVKALFINYLLFTDSDIRLECKPIGSDELHEGNLIKIEPKSKRKEE